MSVFTEFLQNVRKLGLEHYKLYYGLYPAQVMNVNDPQKRGRIKVKVPSILGDKELVEWVTPADVRMAGEDSGEFFPPYEDDWVTVFFEYGRVSMPKYLQGGYWAKNETPSDFKKGYLPFLGPQVKGWMFKSGQKIIIDETELLQKITIQNADDSVIEMSANPLKPSLKYESAKGTKITVEDKSKPTIEMETALGTKMTIGDGGLDAIVLKTVTGATITINKTGGIEIIDATTQQSFTMDKGKTDIKVGTETISMAPGKIDIQSTGQLNMETKGSLKISATQVEIDAKAQLTAAGKAINKFGSSSGMTDVEGQLVKIAGGSVPVAKLGSQVMGVGNLGAPVVGQIIMGSFNVLVK